MSIVSDTRDRFRTLWSNRITSDGDLITIRRAISSSFDAGSGVTTPTWSVVFAGNAVTRPASTETARRLFGENANLEIDLIMFLPFDTTGIEPGDQVIFDAASADPALQSLTGRVESLSLDGYVTRRAIGVIVNQSG